MLIQVLKKIGVCGWGPQWTKLHHCTFE